MFFIAAILGFDLPPSHLLTDEKETFSSLANASCERKQCCRILFISSDKLIFIPAIHNYVNDIALLYLKTEKTNRPLMKSQAPQGAGSSGAW